MKKNITINLCGRLYQIDEDAYELLSHYTETLRNYFRKQEGGEEIANDIEERVAELFDELKAQGIQAITIDHVQEVIRRIGNVDDIAGTEDPDAHDGTAHDGTAADGGDGVKKLQNGKKFYRDSQHKMVSGVLAGCAQYFGGDVNLWRGGYVAVCVLWFIANGGGAASVAGFFVGTLFTLFTLPVLFMPVIPYVLAAIFTPETQTPEDVLRMKGKQVNPQTLAEEVRESTEAKRADDGKQIWNTFVGILAIGASTALTIGFIVALCFFAAWLAAPDLMAYEWWYVEEKEVLDALMKPVTFCGLILLASIAILLYCAIHSALSSFGKTPSMSMKQRIVWFFLWVASLAGFIGSCVYAANKFNKTSRSVREQRWHEEMQEREEAETDTLALSADTLALAVDSLSSIPDTTLAAQGIANTNF